VEFSRWWDQLDNLQRGYQDAQGHMRRGNKTGRDCRVVRGGCKVKIDRFEGQRKGFEVENDELGGTADVRAMADLGGISASTPGQDDSTHE